MSWNKSAFTYIYKRKQKFDFRDYLSEDLHDYENWDRYLWFKELESYDDWGNPKSMQELYRYRVMTLLHRLNIGTASKQMDQIGWY